MTRSTILIGVLSVNSALADKATAIYGCKGCAYGPDQAQAQGPINWINAHGGLAGRKVQVVNYEFNLLDFAAPGTQLASACAAFTQDHHVFLVDALVPLDTRALASCLAAHNTPMIGGCSDGCTASTYNRYADTLYTPVSSDSTVWYKAWTDAMISRGYLTKSTVNGLYYPESPDMDTIVNQVIKPELAAHGMKLAVTFASQNTGDAGSAVLHFRSARVNRAILLGPGATFLFLQSAQNQAYFPKYLLDSSSAPAIMESVPNAFRGGAAGAGSDPFLDVSGARVPSPNPQASLCLRLAHSGGYDQYPSALSKSLMLVWCDQALFIKRVVDSSSSNLNPAGLARTVSSLGQSFSAGSNFVTDFSGSSHAGTAGYRDFVWKESCRCFAYDSPIHTF